MTPEVSHMGKKLLVGFAILLAAIALFIYVGGAFIDPKIELGTEKRLAASPASLFAHLDNVRGLTAWWTLPPEGPKNPNAPAFAVKKADAAGPDQGPGLAIVFESGGKVMETWTVKQSEPPSRIVYDVDFGGVMKVERTLTLTPDGDGTKVSWRETGSVEKPPYRWMKVLMSDESVKQNFELALTALERVALNPGSAPR